MPFLETYRLQRIAERKRREVGLRAMAAVDIHLARVRAGRCAAVRHLRLRLRLHAEQVVALEVLHRAVAVAQKENKALVYSARNGCIVFI